MDKAGKKYWNNSWTVGQIPNVIDPHSIGLTNYANQCFHEYFCHIFFGMETSKMKLIEIGCARSAWLPYFAREFGFEIYGLDYSELGCQQERQILANADVKGEVVCANLFSPPKILLDKFDVVVSFGVVEHFEDTAACIKALSKFLKPNGTLITIIPNMVGLVGLIQKIVNRPVFDIHVPLDSHALAEAHKLSGLQIIDCSYFMNNNFGVCNLNGIQPNSLEWFVKKIILLSLTRFSLAVWFVEGKFRKFKENKQTSPYINCFARKF